ncbi:MAG: 50S ribosomal protein P1 [Candidatus Nanoarchaeia archaeon]|nr:50S ribosomal protein P1 [Candidatus Nanoarchaeia archaeon]
MEYIYSALLLHKAGKEISEENLKKVLTAAGVEVNEARVKSLVAALEGVDIANAIQNAAPVAVSSGAAPAGAHAEKKEDKPEEAKVSTEEAAAGLGALFG